MVGLIIGLLIGKRDETVYFYTLFYTLVSA